MSVPKRRIVSCWDCWWQKQFWNFETAQPAFRNNCKHRKTFCEQLSITVRVTRRNYKFHSKTITNKYERNKISKSPSFFVPSKWLHVRLAWSNDWLRNQFRYNHPVLKHKVRSLDPVNWGRRCVTFLIVFHDLLQQAELFFKQILSAKFSERLLPE